MKKKLFWMGSMFMLLSACLAGCGSSAEAVRERAADTTGAVYTYADTENYAPEEAFVTEEAVEGAVVEEIAEETELDVEATQEGITKKLIRNVDLEVETQNFNELFENLTNEITQLGGYVENSNTSRHSAYDTWYGNITARVPSAALDGFLSKVSEHSNVVSRSESIQDVTLKYVDLDTHKKALLTERDRLLALLEQAETVEDLITIESRLSEVRYQIESMEMQLRSIDNQVDYSTVYINIREVALLTPSADKSVWQEIADGFGNNVYRVLDGIASLAVKFVIALPYFAVWGLLIALCVFLLRLIRKLGRKRKAKKDAGRLLKKQEEDAYEIIPPTTEKEDK